MKLYKATLKPKTSFATSLKGDTIFGHLCWMILYKWGKDKLDKLLQTYKNNKPFLIVSDAFAKNYLPKPNLPLYLLGEENKKESRKKKWIDLEDLKNGNYKNAKRDEEIGYLEEVYEVVKNSINYTTFTTDSGDFAPYGVKEISINDRDIYFLLDEEQFGYEELKEILEFFENFGYGKDVSTGKGRFVFEREKNDIKLTKVELNYNSYTYMSLSPFVLAENTDLEDMFYSTFVRFGKHGFDRVHVNPFKKPILMFDTGSVIKLKEHKKYIGKAITDISVFEDTIHQGYSILIPIKDIENETI